MHHNLSRISVLGFLLLLLMVTLNVAAQQPQQTTAGHPDGAVIDRKPGEPPPTANKKEEPPAASPSVEDRLKALERIIERQQREIETLRTLIEKRHEETPAVQPAALSLVASPTTTMAAEQPAAAEQQETKETTTAQKRLDELYRKFGAFRLSGDVRFRVETFRNQGFDAAKATPDRSRLRSRIRLALDGTLDEHFDWGLRLASGFFTDPLSANQTLTDFYERKPISIDRVFMRYDSKSERLGVQLIAGKFEPPFRRTQLIWDNDLNVEGASEAVYVKTKTPLREVKLVAFQLPFSELSGGKDGVLYGGQLQSDWQLSKTISATVNVGYYDWLRADQVLFALGATATQVNGGIFGGVGVTGNQNGGINTTNRIIRDATGKPLGFLAGFQLVDVLATLTWQAAKHFPVTFTADFVHNASGRIQNEKNGYWIGAQVGQTREKGDWSLAYFYTRIEQDAVLVPFNFSNILASNSRAHMPTLIYQLAHNVSLQWNGLFSQRARQLTSPAPDNRYLKRMHFDVTYRF